MLRDIPTKINLASLVKVTMHRCSRLRTFPDISSNIGHLDVRKTKIEDVPSSVVGHWSHLGTLFIGSKSIKRLTHVPLSVTTLDLSNSDIKWIPDCIIGLPQLVTLNVTNCKKLVSVQSLPPSLESFMANNCVSLKRVCCSFQKPTIEVTFYNCVKLDEESRRRITQQAVHGFMCLPDKELPTEFTHKTTRNSITIPLAPIKARSFSSSSRFKACLLLPPKTNLELLSITCRLISKGGVQINRIRKSAQFFRSSPPSVSEHLFILGGDLFHQQDRFQEVDQSIDEILFEFSSYKGEKIIECGLQILSEEAESSSSSRKVNYLETRGNNNYHTDGQAYKVSQVGDIKSSKQHTSRWSWLKNLVRWYKSR